MPICNKGIRGCVICQNKKISDIVDPIVFGAEMKMADLKEKLENQYGLMCELTELKAHARHVFFIDSDSIDKVSEKKKYVIESKTIDIINDELAELTTAMEGYRRNGQDNTLEFSKMQKTMIELLNMRAKIEGEISDGVIVVPPWLESMDDQA